MLATAWHPVDTLKQTFTELIDERRTKIKYKNEEEILALQVQYMNIKNNGNLQNNETSRSGSGSVDILVCDLQKAIKDLQNENKVWLLPQRVVQISQ